MRTKDFEVRRRASVIVSKLFLICSRALTDMPDRRTTNIATIYPEVLVMMAIRVNDDRRGKPMSINRIAKVTGIPRANVQRFLKVLVAQGAIDKTDGGYISNANYLGSRVNSRYFQMVVLAIRAAAKALDEFAQSIVL